MNGIPGRAGPPIGAFATFATFVDARGVFAALVASVTRAGGCIAASLVCITPAAAAGSGHDSHQHSSSKSAHAHGDAIGTPGDPARVTRTVPIEMNDRMRFVPDHVDVRRGETIRFVVSNAGKVIHEMVVGTAGELKQHARQMRDSPQMKHDDPNAVVVEPGKTGELVWHFTKGGRVDFACLQAGHFEAGMTGRIAVK